MLKINFWKKESGNLMSHSSGLTIEQVDMLKTLDVGDRLVVWINNDGSSNYAHYTLKTYKKSEIKQEKSNGASN